MNLISNLYLQMISYIIVLISTFTTISTQQLEVQDLSNNHGYLPIKLRDVDIIENYAKIIHIINTTQYLETADILQDNVRKLTSTYTNVTPLLYSINQSMTLCKTKIRNLIPKFREKRGLINAIGKGLKYVAGTMDSEDETKIFERIQNIEKTNGETIVALDELTYLSTSISDRIFNITDHINSQQKFVQKYINKFKTEVENRILNLEDETIFLENIFQINNDLNLLMDHVNEIGHVIFNSKLGVVPSDILTAKEYAFINRTESYFHTQVSVSYRGNLVILALNIPNFFNETFAEVIFESLPDKQNKSLVLHDNRVLINKNEVYKSGTLEYKKLIKIHDDCLTNIVKNLEPLCPMNISIKQEEKEIYPGLLIFKNYKDKIVTNCKNSYNLENIKTYLLKFENCIVKTKLKTYENYKININEMFILEKFMLKINEDNASYPNLTIKEIHFNETLKIVNHKLNRNTLINTYSNLSFTTIVIFIVILIYIKNNKRTYIVSSSEPRTNDGGVIVPPNILISPVNII